MQGAVLTSCAKRFVRRESVFGYITVLPGAFSAYRYAALQNDRKGEGPLQKYFLGEETVRVTSTTRHFLLMVIQNQAGASIFSTNIFTANMYLAEDRVSCPNLSCRANTNNE